MIDDNGWQRPERYRPSEEEVRAVRANVGLCDISPTNKLDLKGKELAPVLERLSSSRGLPQIGHSQRVTLRSPDGSTGVEGTCCRLGRDHALLLTEPDTVAPVEQALTQVMKTTPGCIHLTNLTSVLAAVQLVGPRSFELLRKLTALDLSPDQFPDLRCAQGGVAKIQALVVRADVGRTLAYEVYCGREFGEYLWDTLRDAGQEFGVTPFGLAAQRSLRAEG